MVANDTVNYLLFNNPVSSSVWSVLSSASKATFCLGRKNPALIFHSVIILHTQGLKKTSPPPVTAISTTQSIMTQQLWRLAGTNLNIIRFAGFSGVSAVILGAFGAHRKFPEPDEKGRDPRQIFETANRYHFYHTIALLAVPLTRRPFITGTLMITGMAFFCGTCYYSALTGKQDLNKLAPIGGISLILAWLSMIL